MAQPLSTFLARIEEFLPDEIKVDAGAEHLGDNVSPPRIVLVPTTEPFKQPERYSGPGRALHQREIGLDVHLWGKDWEETEEILQFLVFGLRGALGNSYRLGTGRWTQQDAAKIAQLGRTYVLPMTLLAPVVVPEGVEGLGTVTQTDTTDTELPLDAPSP